MKKYPKKISAAALLLLFCLVVQPGMAYDQTQGDNEKTEAQKQTAAQKPKLFREFWEDGKEILTSPFKMKGRHFLHVGIVLAAAGLLVTSDEGITRAVIQFHDRNHSWVHPLSKNLTYMGGPGGWATAGIFLIEGLLARDGKARDTGIMALEAMLQSTIVVQALKLLVSRRRPDAALGQDRWLFLAGFPKHFSSQADDYSSFPGGHAAAAFSLGTVIAEQYKNHGWVPPVCYALAGLVGLTRLIEYRHWASDIVVGAALGFAIGKMVVRNHRKRRMFLPTVMPTKGGVALGFYF
jgi:membrane-associated phospholipid phosphatase